jgi:nucleotide-binding universal stress UspA family protein
MAFQSIVVATDFDECSKAALDQAAELANRYGASLTVVHAFDLPDGYIPALLGDVMNELQNAARNELEKVVKPIQDRLPRVIGVARYGKAWEQILEVAREVRADLIVVGTHGRKRLERVLLGSVAEKVVHLSTVPVLTVRPPMTANATAARDASAPESRVS